jgi:dihydrofolate reductase
MTAHSIVEALSIAKQSPGSEEIFIIGGGQIYAQAIGLVDRLYLTVVEESAPDADTFFPEYTQFTKVIENVPHEENGIRFTYLTLALP